MHPRFLSCVSQSNDICTAAIKNIRNMHAVSTSQIADILHFNDKYVCIYIYINTEVYSITSELSHSSSRCVSSFKGLDPSALLRGSPLRGLVALMSRLHIYIDMV